MFDEATQFFAATLASSITTKSVWETILRLWDNVYTGISNRIAFDKGSQFRDAFVEICELNDVEWKKLGI